MRIVFVQFGDYRDAVRRFARGGAETYHDQRFTVDFVGSLAREAEHVCVIACGADPHDEEVPNGVHSVGMRLWKQASEADLVARIELARPTHLIARSPLLRVLRWGIRSGVRVLPLLADSFPNRTLRERYRNFRLRRLLNHRAIRIIGNHNLPASRDLKDLGVAPWKIVPFDYESRHHISPEQSEPKSRPSPAGPVHIAYVGSITPAKGIGEVIEAVPLMRARGLDVHLTIVGKGAVEDYRKRTLSLGISAAVTFAGVMPHDQIIPLMRQHDLVIVPTRHEFGEGMPGTIFEGLCARTPLLLSDHPIFLRRFRDGEDALIFHAGDPGNLAERVAKLMADPKLYGKLSINSLEAWRRLQMPVGWGELLRAFLRDEPADRQWFRDYSLGSGRYDAM